jgi:prepilin-type N-terminal cleavage/methylation domain-containing protein
MRRQSGFTLLEMMIAMAILSGALTWLVVGMTRNITAENHAKMLATATFLAREKMVEFEDELYEKGFSEFEKEQNGKFEEQGFSRFEWRVIVDKVELPSSEQLQTALTKAQEAKQALAGGGSSGTPPPPTSGSSSSSNNSNPLTAGMGAMASQFGIIKDVLEQGIRRVTVKIVWNEGKTNPREIEVVSYYTDVRKVDQAIMIGGSAPAAGASPGTTPTTPTTGAPK